MKFENALFVSEVAVPLACLCLHIAFFRCSALSCVDKCKHITQSLFKFKIHSIKLLFVLELLLMTISFGVSAFDFPLFSHSYSLRLSPFFYLFLPFSLSLRLPYWRLWVQNEIQSFAYSKLLWVVHSFVWPFIEYGEHLQSAWVSEYV